MYHCMQIDTLGVDGGGLSYNFYEQSCPQAEDIVRDAMRAVFMADPAAPPALLRLMFHDCQVQGCDASILVDEDANGVQITSEITAARNFGVRNRDSISYAKSLLESQCPGQVSCSDVIIMAARDAVAFLGGPLINVPLGRRDSSNIPSSAVADSSIPPPNIQVGDMLRLFAKKGMTTEESVAIIGAHTIGATHCVNLMNRLYRSDRPSTDGMNPAYELMLRSACPRFSLTPNISIVANDLTMVTFDNHYYRSLMAGQGALAIDTAMASDPRTAPFVARFASDQDQFFNAFSSAFVKLSYSNVLTGNQGVIRENCARM
uniref:Peroxidase n=1 Tax=Kalanchoe fedtschenkoi TaxID=63787 RepID=A0A7N0ZRJ5_KALFE